MLREGPEVSLSGSPTVSPITAALCSSDPLSLTTPSTSYYPDSIYFLGLSQAPPELADEVAIHTPDTRIPGSKPATAVGPNARPKRSGEKITRNPGANICLNELVVEISMHLS